MKTRPLAALLLSASLAACSLLSPKTEADLSGELACVVSREALPPATIALECGVAEAAIVADILAAHRAAVTRAVASASASALARYAALAPCR